MPTQADRLAEKQREISISEFFSKNRHLLGFDNPAKALLTTVKEAVDNSLDACEEARILPNIYVEIKELAESRFYVCVEDNGPGIVKKQVPNVFGRLLYGSKFHRLKQSRGQQGIGISAAGMYSQMTTGKPITVTSKTNPKRPAYRVQVLLNTSNNTPQISNEESISWDKQHGTRVELELQASYKGGRHSVDDYIMQVAITNPHAEFTYVSPKKSSVFQRTVGRLPAEPIEVLPHPYGVDLGTFINIVKGAHRKNLGQALEKSFSCLGPEIVREVCGACNVPAGSKSDELDNLMLEQLHMQLQKVKLKAPRTDCVVPIGEELIRKGLEREVKARLYVSSSRKPVVYRGNPFCVEVGLAYGFKDAEDKDHISLLRFANRVPLQYQQGACAIYKAVTETNWKPYGLQQSRGNLPVGPIVLLVHLASVWVPFTSESKEAIAHYPEIIKEIKAALQDVGRKLQRYVSGQNKEKNEHRRLKVFDMYGKELAKSLADLTGEDAQMLEAKLHSMALAHVTIAEQGK